MSAMARIRTVAQNDLYYLQGEIRRTLSGDFEGASGVEALSKRIKPLLDQNEGLNYKAKRIARTEGVRVAAAAQQEAEMHLVDMLKGQRVSTQGDSRVRHAHAASWPTPPGKLYLRTGAGYTFGDWPGKPPYGPNCRCKSVPVLHDELYAEVS
jgi:hypothetical protein